MIDHERYKRLAEDAIGMSMTPREVEDFIHFLSGRAPDELADATDHIREHRASRPEATEAGPAQERDSAQRNPDRHEPDNAGRLALTLAAIAQVDPSRTGHTGPDTDATAAAYAVRNSMIWWALAEAQSAGVPAGIGYDPADPRPVVVYLQLPTGQVSWHLPAHPTGFDGHDTATKYARVDAYTRQHGLTGGTP